MRSTKQQFNDKKTIYFLSKYIFSSHPTAMLFSMNCISYNAGEASLSMYTHVTADCAVLNIVYGLEVCCKLHNTISQSVLDL